MNKLQQFNKEQKSNSQFHVYDHHSLIPSGSFRDRQEEKWASFRGRNHLGGCTNNLLLCETLLRTFFRFNFVNRGGNMISFFMANISMSSKTLTWLVVRHAVTLLAWFRSLLSICFGLSLHSLVQVIPLWTQMRLTWIVSQMFQKWSGLTALWNPATVSTFPLVGYSNVSSYFPQLRWLCQGTINRKLLRELFIGRSKVWLLLGEPELTCSTVIFFSVIFTVLESS